MDGALRVPIDLPGLCADLAAERQALDEVLATLTPDDWSRPTPAPGWTIRDQITHLAWFDGSATEAIRDPDAFRRTRAKLSDPIGDFVERVAEDHRHLAGDDVRRWLTRADAELREAALAAPPGIRVPWYGPDMSVASAITARLMETWAHGHDVTDAVGLPPSASPRLRHVAHLGLITFANSFRSHGLAVPDGSVRVELRAPDGSTWSFGPDDATGVVTGDALDFCEVVTQRRHRADTGLVARGEVADRWLDVAQAFAGPAGAGRSPTRPPQQVDPARSEHQS